MLLSSTKKSILLAFSYLIAQSQARPATYSVVDVDGGSAATATATAVATAVTGQGAEPAQSSSTTTQTPAAVVTKTLEAPTVLVTIVQQPSQQTAPSSTTTQRPSIITNTVYITETASATGSTAYYDDGLWHTYYPIKDFQPPKPKASSFAQPPSWNQTVPASTTSATPALATGALVPDQTQQKREVQNEQSEAFRRAQKAGGYGWSMGNK